jgi:hypothetical protein
MYCGRKGSGTLRRKIMNDESHLPVKDQSLVFRLRKRAEIRRQIPGRLAAVEGKPDKIADLLDEAADKIESLEREVLDSRDLLKAK